LEVGRKRPARIWKNVKYQSVMEYNGVESAVYVGTYRKYNEGSIFGKWMRLSDYNSFEEFADACRELHKDEDDPEFMCQDYEGLPSGLYCEAGIGWLEDIFDLMELSEEDRAKVLEYWGEVDDKADPRTILDRYYCENMDDEDFGYLMAEGLEIPEYIENYFDYERFGHDCKFDYTITSNYIWLPC